MSDPGTSGPRSEKEIFFEALEKPTPQERAAFLDGRPKRMLTPFTPDAAFSPVAISMRGETIS